MRRGLTLPGVQPDLNVSLGLLDDATRNLTGEGLIGTAYVTGIDFFEVTLSPSAVAANTSAEQVFAVMGLSGDATVIVNKPTAQAGLAIVGARVSAKNTLAITFGNFTGAPITPTASEIYRVVALREVK